MSEVFPKAALIVYAAKTETGVSMKSVGQHRYQILESDGLQLILTKKVGRFSENN